MSSFETHQIFQQSRILSKRIYEITREGDFRYDTRFVQQIRAAAGSVMITSQKAHYSSFINLSKSLAHIITSIKSSDIKGIKYKTT